MNNDFRGLNLGCGNVFHPDWINIDVQDQGEHVLTYNLNLGIPFADKSFDIVYHSHILEHFSKQRAEFFLKECFRVLKEGAILRIAIPDLEMICKDYLQALEDIKAGKKDGQEKRRWMTIVLLDQIVRDYSGGEMATFTTNPDLQISDYIIKRHGKATAKHIEYYKTHPRPIIPNNLSPLPTLDVNFKLSGELHQWMYDFYAIEELLTEIGFVNIVKQNYNTSKCDKFSLYHFDTDEDGNVRKPDSLFIEAEKPKLLNSKKELRVAIFNTFDSGGAALGTIRQHEALRKLGVISELYVATETKLREACHLAPTRNNSILNYDKSSAILSSFSEKLDNWNRDLENYQNITEYCSTFSDSIVLKDIPLIDDFDIINLEWVIGFADPFVHPEYYEGKNIVLTLRDMNALTGGCHYNGGCEKYKTHCENCHLLYNQNTNDKAKEIFQKKLSAYKKLKMHIVTPTKWLASKVKESALLKDFPVTVIEHPMPLDVFTVYKKDDLRRQLGINKDDIILLYSSDVISNPRKGYKYFLELLQRLAKTSIASKILVLVMGKQIPEELFQTGLRTQALGFVSDPKNVAIFYNVADASILPSIEDNMPKTVCESLACGTPVIAFKAGGVPEMIIHEKTGYLAECGNVDELLEGINWLTTIHGNINTRKACRAFALEHYDETKQAQKYKDLYLNILNQKLSNKKESKLKIEKIIDLPSNNSIYNPTNALDKINRKNELNLKNWH